MIHVSVLFFVFSLFKKKKNLWKGEGAFFLDSFLFTCAAGCAEARFQELNRTFPYEWQGPNHFRASLAASQDLHWQRLKSGNEARNHIWALSCGGGCHIPQHVFLFSYNYYYYLKLINIIVKYCYLLLYLM